MPRIIGKRARTHRMPFKRALVPSEGVTQGGAKQMQPRATLFVLGAILRGGATSFDKPLSDSIALTLYTYLHILTNLQRGYFSLWRAKRIQQVQSMLDKHNQLYLLNQR